MALHPRSDCLSKELVRLRSDTSVYPFRIVTNLHDFNSTEACVTNVVQSPVQCGPGQIAPPLMMLLFSACKPNRSKALPPSSSDGWGCWLLSKAIVDYFHPDCYMLPSILDETILPNNCCCLVSSWLILSTTLMSWSRGPVDLIKVMSYIRAQFKSQR